ncbi:MAG TPA: bacteriohopanetetrol glucosamine biosynthesis glycosyltransferase HpnI [Thermoanaerobaculia bacterium]|nr:bacteriohopanetetrol glucosamine biosynthesis glycosyltransferase HpnI [Thermoanaerobaculia bacterium]
MIPTIAAALTFSIAYTIFAVARVLLFPRRAESPALHLPPVTIAKPLCGDEPELEENLRSFCEQDYPSYEVIFAVASPDDPAIAVARRVMRANDRIVIAPPGRAKNRKVNSLIAIERDSTSPILVVADSDIRAGRDYLRTIVAEFDDPRVAGVTAVYSGRATPALASRLGAMYISESFLPSVLVATALAPLDFFLGATMAVRRDALRQVGGFEALADDLADDYMLGRRLRAAGHDLRLAKTIVETTVSERTTRELLRREIRWSRTIRTVRPIGHFFTILTMPLVWAAILLLVRRSPLAIALACVAIVSRIAMHSAAKRSASWIWIPLRDALTFAVYCASFLGRRVVWRDRPFGVSADGQLHEQT